MYLPLFGVFGGTVIFSTLLEKILPQVFLNRLGLSKYQILPGTYMLPQVPPAQALGKAKTLTVGITMPLYLNYPMYKQ